MGAIVGTPSLQQLLLLSLKWPCTCRVLGAGAAQHARNARACVTWYGGV